MPSLVDLLVEVHARKGFVVARRQRVTGASGTPYEIPVTATRGDETVLVFASPRTAVPAEDLNACADIVRDVGATRAIVAAPEQADAFSPEASVHVWTRDVIVREVGSAVLASVLEDESAADEAAAAAPVAPAGSDIIDPEGPSRAPKRFPSLLSRAAGAAMNPSETAYLYKSKPRPSAPDREGRPLAYAWSANAAAGTSPTHSSVAEIVPSKPRRAPAAPAPAADADDVELVVTPRKAPAAAPAEAPAAVPEGAHAAPADTVALRVDRARAEQAAGAGAVHAARLVLEPHICFDYDAHVAREGLPSPLTGKGVVLVNAVTGEIRDGPAFEAAPHLPTEFEPPAAAKLQAADVYDKVKSRVRKTFSREVKAMRVVGESEVYETVRVKPELEELGMDHRGIVNLPVWVLETDKGVVKVDGSTGDVL